MQQESTVLIKGMVCNRCIMTVSNDLRELGYAANKVNLGEVNFTQAIGEIDLNKVEEKLALHGFHLLHDRKMNLVKEVKQLVEHVYSGSYDFPDRFRFSDLIHQRWNKNYEVVSDAFFALENITLERYIIEYRINRVKEYLVNPDVTLADVAFRLNFYSVAHLSAQFKQVTGLTTSFFRATKIPEALLLPAPGMS